MSHSHEELIQQLLKRQTELEQLLLDIDYRLNGALINTRDIKEKITEALKISIVDDNRRMIK